MDNIYFDLGPWWCISNERIRLGIDKLGAEKFLFGSDTPFGNNNIENNLNKLYQLELKENDLEKILALNVEKILSLT